MQTLPGLIRYQLTPHDNTSISSDFKLVCRDANLMACDNGDINLALNIAVPGVYFLTVIIGKITYKIYIGKTNSLQRRVKEYLNEFQPHSPNDYKLRCFQQRIIALNPKAIFHIYFACADREDCTRLETDAVDKYRPLLNERGRQSDESKETFRRAFEAFYWQGLEDQLSNDA